MGTLASEKLQVTNKAREDQRKEMMTVLEMTQSTRDRILWILAKWRYDGAKQIEGMLEELAS